MPKYLGKRLLIIGALCLTCIGVLYGLFVLYIFLINPLTTGFQAYTPTVLPTGVHITGHVTQQLLYYGEKHVDIGTNIPAFYINESKALSDERSGVYPCGNNINPTTCGVYTSSRGQKYQVLTSQDDKGSPSLITISWARNGTLIMISIEAPASTQYVGINWSKIVDGFMPTNYGYERGSVIRDTGA